MESGDFIDGNAPYGYRMVDRVLIPNEDEAQIVRDIFDQYLKGASTHEIARNLNDAGIPGKFGITWKVSTIRYILRNEKYIGDMLCQKTYHTNTLPFKQKRNHGEADQYYVEGSHEGIVDKNVFEKAQEIINSRKEKYLTDADSIQYPLTSKMHCTECGAFFIRKKTNGCVSWVCSNHGISKDNCPTHYIREIRIYDAFVCMINKLRFSQEQILDGVIKRLDEAIRRYRLNNADCLNNVCEAVRRLHDESDFEKLSAAMQMADVDDSGSIAVIANQLSDFIYIPDAEDNEDVGRYWIENIFGYEYDEALEDYIDFASFGEDVINDHDCSFLDTGGFIALEDGVSLDRMLEAAKAEKKFCENIAPPKPTPDDPNLITERFFFPLKYSVGTYNEYGDMDWEADAEDLNGSFGDRYESEIVNSFIKYTELDSCDMIEYFDQSESARAKIMSAKWGFDNIDGTLFGVVTAKLKEPLTGDEEEVFKDWILGQNSDGLGEGFEQQDIEIDDGILNVHFWNSSDEYYVENEDDFYNRMDNGMGGMM